MLFTCLYLVLSKIRIFFMPIRLPSVIFRISFSLNFRSPEFFYNFVANLRILISQICLVVGTFWLPNTFFFGSCISSMTHRACNCSLILNPNGKCMTSMRSSTSVYVVHINLAAQTLYSEPMFKDLQRHP